MVRNCPGADRNACEPLASPEPWPDGLDEQLLAQPVSRTVKDAALPSLDVALAHAGACGGQRAEWWARWQPGAREGRSFMHLAVPVYCCRCTLERRLGECVAADAVAAAV